MSDPTPRNSRETKADDTSSNESSISQVNRNKALLVSISTAVLLVIFAVVTLFRTDFDTYPEDVDIKLTTRAPSALSHEEKSALVDNHIDCEETDDCDDEAVVDEESDIEVLIAAGESQSYEAAQQETGHREQDKIRSLQVTLGQLQEQLQEKDDIIFYLKDELHAAKSWEQDSRQQVQLNQEFQAEYRELLTANRKLEEELQSTLEQLKRDEQNPRHHTEYDQELRGLKKREESLLRENAQLEDRITADQQKFADQEKTFRELRTALKTHKEALRRMDQSRIELAAELDATKGQYAKLLQAVASHAKTTGSAAEIDALVASSKEASQATLDQQRQADKRYHVVKKGDTLSGISRHYYGTAQRWHEIYEANQAMLNDQNRLKVGLVLVIP